jgi:hypothetical protein
MFEKIFSYSANHEIEKVFGIRLPNQKISILSGIILLAPAIFFLCALFVQQVMHENMPWLSTMFTWHLGAPLIIFYFVIIFFPILAFLINLRFFFSIWLDEESNELKLSFKTGLPLFILSLAGLVIVMLFIIHGIGDASGSHD